MLNNLKPYLFGVGIPVVIVGLLALGALYLNNRFNKFESLGAPTSTPARNIIPLTNNKFDIGTTTPGLEWKNIFVVNAYVSSLVGCDTIDTNGAGLLACGSDATGAGGGSYPFTPQTFGGTQHSASTTRPFYFGQGLLTSSSTIGTLTAGAITATSTLTVTPLTSALILTDADGLFAEYTGSSCTNQFIRSLSALGAATCATVVAGDVDLADLTATNGTLTFSGTYDGQTARTIGLNLGNANTWTASSTWPNINVGWIFATSTTVQSNFNQASTTQLSVSDAFYFPNAANPSITALSQFAVDTTSGFLIGATSSVDEPVVYARPIKRLYSFVLASTSISADGFASGDYIALPTEADGIQALFIMCTVWGETSIIATLRDDSGNATNNTTCATTGTTTEYNITSGGVFTAGEGKTFRLGTVTGAPNYLNVAIYGTITRD